MIDFNLEVQGATTPFTNLSFKVSYHEDDSQADLFTSWISYLRYLVWMLVHLKLFPISYFI